MEKFTFEGALGHPLAARLDRPEGTLFGFALFAHCFTCGKDLQPAHRIAKQLNVQGIAVVRFDFTGLGSSGGEFENTNFSSNVSDLVAVANAMREQLEAPQLLIGHSLGGTAAILAAQQIPEVKGVVTIGSPSSTEHVSDHFKESVEQIEKMGEAKVNLAGRPFTIKKQFLDDIRGQNVQKAAANLKKALLVCHSPIDEVVSVEHAAQLFEYAKHPKSFLSLDQADHLLFKPGSAEYIANAITGWASAYIPQQAVHLSDLPYNEVVVHPKGGKFTHEVQAGPYTILADEPKEYGGDEQGPPPYSFLLAALGSCTAMTIKLYAAHKKIPLEGVQVHLKHNKIHAEDCASCETKEGKIDRIEAAIQIEGNNITPEQRAGILRIANRCPVHKTLHSEVEIVITES